MTKLTKAEIAAQIAALQAELARDEGGIYQDARTGRWFIVVRPAGRTTTTTRRRAPDGRQLLTREQARAAKAEWEAQGTPVPGPVGRERFATYWPRYLRHAKGNMTSGSWEDLSAHGAKRLLPFFAATSMARLDVAAVREWRAVMLEAVEAGDWAPKTINNARIALLGCCRMAVQDGLMTHNPVLDVRPLAVEFRERPYLRLAHINPYLNACAPHYRPLAQLLIAASAAIPAAYLSLYRQAGAAYGVPWAVLAAIGAIETDHGRSRAPGVRSGLNAFGCCAGPMQFNLRNGPPSTWQSYRTDGDADGTLDPYSPADAIASAGRYLQALLKTTRGDIARAVYGYNHSAAYVTEVLERAQAYGTGGTRGTTTPQAGSDIGAGGCATGPATDGARTDLGHAERRTAPRAYTALPPWAMAGGRGPELIDARLLAGALWLLRRYDLRVTAARKAGHNTHGDGTALDLVPTGLSEQQGWDASAGALARDLGWTRKCAASGVRPVCALVPAIQFVGYEGFPGHGSPRTCSGSCAAHLHISWVSPCYGTRVPSDPCRWVASFAAQRSRRDRTK